jgi:uncharacterized caspase-like protein
MAVISACSPGQLVLESSSLDGGFFTYYLLDGLSGAAVGRGTGLIRLDDFAANLMATIRLASFGRVTPFLLETAGMGNAPLAVAPIKEGQLK